jgi:cytochrome c oxidase assembly protein subunit 15
VQRAAFTGKDLFLPASVRSAAWGALGLLGVQLSLGGWVSSNYAVLACTGFPQCNGAWWPSMDFAGGFTVLRELGGLTAHGRALTLDGLVAIHMAHRLVAVLVVGAFSLLAWRLWRSDEPSAQRYGIGVALLLLAQLASGLSNVVLGWPLVAALAHSAGAAALVLTLVTLLARSATQGSRTWSLARASAA